MAAIVEIRVADDAGAWRSAGFAVADGGRLRIGHTAFRLVDGDRSGIVGWTLGGLTAPPPGGTLDGLPTEAAGDDAGPGAGSGAGDRPQGGDRPDSAAGPPVHPNGAVRVDHVVVTTPDLDRTTAALAAVGLDARRTREAGTGPDGTPRLQRFFRLGEVILELVGPAEPTGDGPARFWGLAHEVTDLDTTAALLAGRLSRPRDAVQAGRRIAALRPGAGVTVPTAFLSPEPRRSHR